MTNLWPCFVQDQSVTKLWPSCDQVLSSYPIYGLILTYYHQTNGHILEWQNVDKDWTWDFPIFNLDTLLLVKTWTFFGVRLLSYNVFQHPSSDQFLSCKLDIFWSNFRSTYLKTIHFCDVTFFYTSKKQTVEKELIHSQNSRNFITIILHHLDPDLSNFVKSCVCVYYVRT